MTDVLVRSTRRTLYIPLKGMGTLASKSRVASDGSFWGTKEQTLDEWEKDEELRVEASKDELYCLCTEHRNEEAIGQRL